MLDTNILVSGLIAPADDPAVISPETSNNEAMDRNSILLRLAEFKRTRAREFDLKLLGVFGSVARGDATDESDIDIVFGTGNPNLLRTVALRNELESLLGKSVDVIRLRDQMNPRLRASIERDAVYV